MLKDILLFMYQMIWCTIIQLLGILLGFILVPIMLLFGRFDERTKIPFSEHAKHKHWMREVFPKLFWSWDNEADSSVGDKRGWWHVNSFGADSYKFFNRFWWMAVRNPFNNFKRRVLGVDSREYIVTKIAGQDYVRDDIYSTGWQFLKATPKDGGLPRYTFYFVKEYGYSRKALVIQLGNKIRLSHNTDTYESDIEYFKGFTLEVNPYKDIS